MPSTVDTKMRRVLSSVSDVTGKKPNELKAISPQFFNATGRPRDRLQRSGYLEAQLPPERVGQESTRGLELLVATILVQPKGVAEELRASAPVVTLQDFKSHGREDTPRLTFGPSCCERPLGISGELTRTHRSRVRHRL
jgi:hypothetical protein